MKYDELSLRQLLEFILKQNSLKTSVVISKAEIMESLRNYYNKLNISVEPSLVFEEFEPLLRVKNFFINNHFIHYNFISEKLTLEKYPSLQFMERASEKYLRYLKEEVVKKLINLNFDVFERLMKEIFSGIPWIEEIEITQLTNDGGIDFTGKYIDSNSGLKMPIFGQVKHWKKSKVGSPQIRDFIGSLVVNSSEPSLGLFVSTCGFTRGVKDVIKKSSTKILLLDVNDLAELMIKYNIGIQTYLIEGKVIEDTFWNEIF